LNTVRRLYTILFYLSLPFAFLRLIFRSRKNPAYRLRWSERMGLVPVSQSDQWCVWVHAVSVGETIAALPVVRLLLQHPGVRVVFTTTTPTGSEQVKRLYGDTVKHYYMPYDLPGFMHRFMQRLKIDTVVIMETEVWPNLLYVAKQNRLPVFLINARMAESSAARYARFSAFSSWVFSHFTQVFARHINDVKRFCALGVSEGSCVALGNVKFDIDISASVLQRGKVLQEQLSGRPVWIAASTHEGEDDVLLSVHQRVLQCMPGALLILVPRHPERFDSVAELVRHQRLQLQRYSDACAIKSSSSVFLLDAMGQLLPFYAASDVVFMGGTWVPVGGHNFLEPAALAKPLLSGKHLHHFKELSDQLVGVDALHVVESADALVDSVIEHLQSAELCQQRGRAAQALLEHSRGASQRIVNAVLEYLPV
jgi:3-deoxy-D-manno-octulosonic-acid transferase